jgi:hypothetical protein
MCSNVESAQEEGQETVYALRFLSEAEERVYAQSRETVLAAAVGDCQSFARGIYRREKVNGC